VIGRDGGDIKSRELKAAVPVGGAHHRDLDALSTQSGDAAGPFAFDVSTTFEGKPKFDEELNGGIKILHHDTNVVHALDCHDVSLSSTFELTDPQRQDAEGPE
jgi:hypothetical protein